MKQKKTGTIMAFGILAASFAQAASACDSEQISLQRRVDAVIDAGTGNLLFAQNEDTKFFHASMTKRMTLLLTLQALREGRLQRDQRIPLSTVPYNNGRGGVENGDAVPFVFREISVWDAVLAMNTGSSNRAPQALAIAIAGSENSFAERMNEEASRLGIDAHFENPAGYPTSARVEREHYITALGHARIVRELYLQFPQEMAMLNIARAQVTGFTSSGRGINFDIGTTNRFLREGIYRQPEVEGGKTGTTCASGASMDAVWRINGRLVIGVTAGHRISAGRYDALVPHIRNPGGVFRERLAESETQERQTILAQAWGRSYAAPEYATGHSAWRVNFNTSREETAPELIMPSPPEPPPSLPDQPNIPPFIPWRSEMAENHLRPSRF